MNTPDFTFIALGSKALRGVASVRKQVSPTMKYIPLLIGAVFALILSALLIWQAPRIATSWNQAFTPGSVAATPSTSSPLVSKPRQVVIPERAVGTMMDISNMDEAQKRQLAAALGISYDEIANETVLEVFSQTTEDLGHLRTEDAAASLGAGGKSVGDKLSESLTGQPSKVSLTGSGTGSAEAGAFQKQLEAETKRVSQLQWAAFIVGLLLALGSIACFIKTWVQPGLYLGLAALALMGTAFYPELLPIGIGIAFIALAGPYIYQTFMRLRTAQTASAVVAVKDAEKELAHSALASVAAGIEDIPDVNMRKMVKDLIAKHATDAEEEVIFQVKKAEGLRLKEEKPTVLQRMDAIVNSIPPTPPAGNPA